MREPAATGWMLCLCLALGGMTLAYPRTALDSSSFTYVASVMVDGGALYRDAWEVKGPGIFIVYALGLVLFGKSAIGLRVLYLLWEAATALVVVAIARRLYRRPEVSFAAGVLYVLLSFTPAYWHLAQPDGFLRLPLALGCLLALRAMDHDRWGDWVGCAAAIGVAATLKLPLGLVGLSPLWAAFRAVPSGWTHVLRRWALLALGLMVPAVLVWMYLSYANALQDFAVSQLVVAPQYTARLRSLFSFRCFVENVMNPGNVPLLALGSLVAVRALRAHRRREERRAGEVVLTIWAGVAVIVLVVHGAYLGYHFLPLTPPVAILGAAASSELWERRLTLPTWRRSALAGIFVAAGVVPLARFAQNAWFTASTLSNGLKPPPWRAVSDVIRRESSPRDTVFVWGNEPAIYLDSGRRSASRFSFALFLAHPWRGCDLRALCLRELRERVPLLFVLVKAGDSPRCEAATTRDELKAYNSFPELRRFVEQSYRLEYEDAGHLVYRRTGALFVP